MQTQTLFHTLRAIAARSAKVWAVLAAVLLGASVTQADTAGRSDLRILKTADYTDIQGHYDPHHVRVYLYNRGRGETRPCALSLQEYSEGDWRALSSVSIPAISSRHGQWTQLYTPVGIYTPGRRLRLTADRYDLLWELNEGSSAYDPGNGVYCPPCRRSFYPNDFYSASPFAGYGYDNAVIIQVPVHHRRGQRRH